MVGRIFDGFPKFHNIGQCIIPIKFIAIVICIETLPITAASSPLFQATFADWGIWLALVNSWGLYAAAGKPTCRRSHNTPQ